MKQMLIIGLLIMIIAVSGCTTQKPQMVGNDRDIHGCIGSAGYSWCEANQKCIRVWEENCTEATAPSAGEVQPTPAGNLGIKKDVEISGFAFNPSTLTIPKGATVIWTNSDSASHTIVSDSGNEINSNSISKGETYAQTFSTTGTYDYHCGIHPSMKGKIIVE